MARARCPGTALNRGDMARAVAISMGLEPYSKAQWKSRFEDIDDVPWLARYIVPLVAAGVVNGYPDGTFKPQAPLRRDQMATFLAKALKLPPAAPSFTDVKNTKSPHHLNIGAVRRAGVTSGTTARSYDRGGSMRPDPSASLLVRAFDLVGTPGPEHEPEVVTSATFAPDIRVSN